MHERHSRGPARCEYWYVLSIPRNSLQMIKRVVFFIFLIFSLVFPYHRFLSGVSSAYYRGDKGEFQEIECKYYYLIKECTPALKMESGGVKLFLVGTVSMDNSERSSGFRLGWGKKNFCLSEEDDVVQIKSEQSGLLCEDGAVFVAKNECYRQDYRDIVDYCD